MTLHTYELISIACALLILLIVLIKVLRIINGKERYTLQEKKAIDTYGYLPKATKNHYALWVVLILLIAASSCSPKGTLNCGSTYKLYAPKFKA